MDPRWFKWFIYSHTLVNEREGHTRSDGRMKPQRENGLAFSWLSPFSPPPSLISFFGKKLHSLYKSCGRCFSFLSPPFYRRLFRQNFFPETCQACLKAIVWARGQQDPALHVLIPMGFHGLTHRMQEACSSWNNSGKTTWLFNCKSNRISLIGLIFI